MIILGVDPGTHATGYGVIDAADSPSVLAAGVVRPPAGSSLPERLLAIHRELTAVIARYGPQACAVESVFNARNARSSLVLGHARGVVLLTSALAGLTVGEYAPREVKKAVTGNGAAGKEQVRFMVRRWLRMSGPPPPLDASDALAVALCHLTRSSLPALMSGRRVTGGKR
jgi:crossover junction endodeoxyribonuclease RuvC